MKLDKFMRDSGLADLDETQKVLHFAFYELRKHATEEFTAGDGAKWVRENRLGNPNVLHRFL